MTKELSPTRASIWQRLRVSRVGVTIAVIVFLVLGGTGAYAYWAVTASLSTSAGAGSLEVSTAWSTSVGKTFTNESYTATGAVTVTNNTSTLTQGETSMPYTLDFTLPSASADPNPLKSALVLKAWKTSSGKCETVPSSPLYTGTWGDLVANPLSSSLKPLASEIWCIETSVDERSKLGSVNGSVSLKPSVTAKLKLTGTSWTKTSAAADGAVQETQAIYLQQPLTAGSKQIVASNGLCVDVKRGSTGSGTYVLQFACHGQANQQWAVNAVTTGSVNDSKYVRFTPQSATGKRLTGVPALATVVDQAGGNEQQWQLQERGSSSGVFQIVNRSTGKCLTSPSSSAGDRLTQISCSMTDTAQEFRFRPSPTYLVCKDTNPITRNLYTLPTPAGPGYTLDVLDTRYRNKAVPQSSTEFIMKESGGPGDTGDFGVVIKDQDGFVVHFGGLRGTWFVVFLHECWDPR